MDDGAPSTALDTFLRALAQIAAALVVGAGLCALLLNVDSSPADTGPVLRLAMWCALIVLSALGIGAYLAARRAPQGSSQIVIVAGVVAYVLLGLVAIAMTGRDGGGPEVTLSVLPVAVAACAFGAVAGRR